MNIELSKREVQNDRKMSLWAFTVQIVELRMRCYELMRKENGDDKLNFFLNFWDEKLVLFTCRQLTLTLLLLSQSFHYIVRRFSSDTCWFGAKHFIYSNRYTVRISLTISRGISSNPCSINCSLLVVQFPLITN